MSGVLIMAGGTGGHVFPGLAVARRLIAEQIPVVWMGTRKGFEARAVPASGLAIDMEWLSIQGVRHKGWLGWLLLPFTLIYAMVQAFRILRRHRPDVVLSMGGFAAGPGGLVAWLTRTPLLLHEQNAVPGMTNKWLALLADQVLCGFPESFGLHVGARHVGNPVRAAIVALAPPEQRLAGRRGNLRLLVIGGSQGAKIFNEVVPEAVKALPADLCPEVWHQCGRNAEVATQTAYVGAAVKPRVTEFIDDMAAAYDWADLVLCRAGAMTVSELSASGSAAILVPYLHAVDDHQTANARFLSDDGAGVLLPQPECTAVRLRELLAGFAAKRELLIQMATAARQLAITDADVTVANICRGEIHA